MAIGSHDLRSARSSGGVERATAVVSRGTDETKIHISGKGGMTDTPVYHGNALPPGAIVEGPLVIEPETTTILILPQQPAAMDAGSNYPVERA